MHMIRINVNLDEIYEKHVNLDEIYEKLMVGGNRPKKLI